MQSPEIEICLEGIDSCVIAEQHGAHRIELCANLLEGGTTPSYGCIRQAKTLTSIPIMVMVRPRGGDFVYSAAEFQVMKQDILMCKDLGVAGVVFGILQPSGRFDAARMKELVDLAAPMQVTCHRAFDVCRDPIEAVLDLSAIGGIQRILTSGQEPSVLEGLPLINRLLRMCQEQALAISIMPGCGINERNLGRIKSELDPSCTQLHMALPRQIESAMEYRPRNGVFMGVALTSSEYSIAQTDPALVRLVTGRK
ncbi:hypothetical protein HDV03_002104 [Kappamyces sp. JEL0829]|nr:hypothetical protein HDV03_002104 [Kappamyces sp. JEL0829]